MLTSIMTRSAIVVLLCSLSVSAHALADNTTKHPINIPAEDLKSALEQLSNQSGTDLVYRPEQVKGLKTRGAVGELSSREAVTKLLQGTRLTVSEDSSGALLIAAPLSAAASAASGGGVQSDSPSDRSSLQLAQATNSSTPGDASVVAPDDRSKKDQSAKGEVLEEVVVTGTYIHNVQPITPVLTISQADLIDQGYTTLAQAIFDLPQNYQGGGTSPSSNIATGFGGAAAAANNTFASGINLRGLGGNATLVLLNGRRLAPTAQGGTVDISQIPVSAIDRVEILTDGASALYGSDAVAGVVNIITRRDFSGVEIGGRAMEISEGKTPDYGADIVGGYSWGGGGFVASADYQKDNSLFARNRSFSNTLPDPWALTPQDQAEHLYLSVNQKFTDQLKFSMDSLLTHRDYEVLNNLYLSDPPYTNSGKVNQYNISPELDYAISPSWTATLIGQWSKEQDSSFTTYGSGGVSMGLSNPVDYEVISVEPRIDGKLFDLPGGAVRAAVGSQWREEKLDYAAAYTSGATFSIESSRHVVSAYGELMVPIVGRENAVPFVQEFRIDVSGRYDHYSDFGGTTNPKVGFSWSPVNDLKLHGSYARSFQAPTLYDLAPNLTAAVAPSADPSSPTGSSLALADLSQGNPNLLPETAKSFTVGFTYAPSVVPGLKFDASYFSIDFDNEITYLSGNPFCAGPIYCTAQDEAALGSLFERNPSLAQINSILNNPAYALYNLAGGNYNPGPYTPSDIKFIANIGLENAASTRVHGIDLAPRYVAPETPYGRFRADLDASYFIEYRQQVTSGSPPIDIDNRTYSPLRFRAKANFGWDKSDWATNVRVNFANAYQNTIDTSTRCLSGGCTISSWTTVDLGLSYTVPKGFQDAWLGGMRLAITATNLFNRPPPFVSSTYPQNDGFDPVNASPLLRSISFTFTKRWGIEGSR